MVACVDRQQVLAGVGAGDLMRLAVAGEYRSKWLSPVFTVRGQVSQRLADSRPGRLAIEQALARPGAVHIRSDEDRRASPVDVLGVIQHNRGKFIDMV